MTNLPFFDLKRQYGQLQGEIDARLTAVLASQQFILGPQVGEFEAAFARAHAGVQAVACASGSDALLLALMALEIGPGDEVITTPFTFIATATAASRLGARMVFVDIDPATFNIDPARLAAAFTPRTKAVIAVHLFGQCCDLAAMLALTQPRGIRLVEDVAQAQGAQFAARTAGTIGDLGTFSFYPSKNLGAYGDGGMVTAREERLARAVRVLAQHGSTRKYHYDRVGINSRLDTLQAAVLLAKLPHVPRWIAARRAHARRYDAAFADAPVVTPAAPARLGHTYNQYTLRVSGRDAFAARLRERGVPTVVYYPEPLHLQPAFQALGYRLGDLPEAERACQEVLSLPIFPELTEAEQDTVIAAVLDACATPAR